MRLRIFQIRAFASFLNLAGSYSVGRNLVARLRSNHTTRTLLDALLGFRRVFPSFETARTCASQYIPAGHEHPDEIRYHTSIAGTVRESDYPVLFHLAPLAPRLGHVFDLGGNVGNLFYAYQTKLSFPSGLRWTVYDLPMKKPIGEQLATQRGESRICFANSLADASGADVLIASGSLHYFDEPLPDLLRSLQELPDHVFVNRTPCSAGADLITVQDSRSYLVPCKLHSRATLVSGMQALGYHLDSEWPVYERRLSVPTHPDLCPRTYSGFYFRRE